MEDTTLVPLHMFLDNPCSRLLDFVIMFVDSDRCVCVSIHCIQHTCTVQTEIAWAQIHSSRDQQKCV